MLNIRLFLSFHLFSINAIVVRIVCHIDGLFVARLAPSGTAGWHCDVLHGQTHLRVTHLVLHQLPLLLGGDALEGAIDRGLMLAQVIELLLLLLLLLMVWVALAHLRALHLAWIALYVETEVSNIL